MSGVLGCVCVCMYVCVCVCVRCVLVVRRPSSVVVVEKERKRKEGRRNSLMFSFEKRKETHSIPLFYLTVTIDDESIGIVCLTFRGAADGGIYIYINIHYCTISTPVCCYLRCIKYNTIYDHLVSSSIR